MTDLLITTFDVQSNYPLLTGNTSAVGNVSWMITAPTGANASDLTVKFENLRTVNVSGQTWNCGSVNVYLTEATTGESRLRLHKAGTYRFTFAVTVRRATGTSGTTTYTRYLNISIQPDVTVSRIVNGNKVDMVHTVNDGQAVSSNPLNQPRKVELVTTTTALAARAIPMDESEGYSKDLTIKSNAPFRIYHEDLQADTGLAIKGKFKVTRSVPAIPDAPAITNPGTSNAYFAFISDTGNLLRDNVTLGLLKHALAVPLHYQTVLELRHVSTNRYTGTGTGTTTTDPPVTLPLSLSLKTPHVFGITPDILFLDDVNNYSSFIAVEANDEATWTLTPNSSQIVVTPSTGTGRAVVEVKTASNFNWGNQNFHTFEIEAESTVGSSTITPPKSTVYVERYTPTKNALVPTQASPSPFDNTLSIYPLVGQWKNDNDNFNGTVSDLVRFPSVTMPLGGLHRIRSWSLQSLGGSSVARATRLILSGKTRNNEWIILDDTGTLATSFYTTTNNTKPRIDRSIAYPKQETKLVEEICVTAVGELNASANNPVRFPQIQVFAGKPVMPIMATNTHGNTIEVQASDTANSFRVFDGAVRGYSGTTPTIAEIGSATWYTDRGMVQNNVANRGVLNLPQRDNSAVPPINDFSSMCWLAVTFPKQQLLGYLYSVDNVTELTGNNAIFPYAASLYFEGREDADKNMNMQGSAGNGWIELGLISLDKCFGNNDIGIPTTTELDQWVFDVLGLTGSDRDKAFLINKVGQWNILWFDPASGTWVDKGHAFTTDTDAIGDVKNRTHYADFSQKIALAQLRFMVQSIMNILQLPPGHSKVIMPEMQFFGLPDETMNKGTVTSVSYLKAEDATGNVHDILGKGKTLYCYNLPVNTFFQATFRFYVGDTNNISPNTLYVFFRQSSGTTITYSQSITNSFIDITAARTYAANPSYYEVYVTDPSGNKIILSSGYTGIPPGGGSNSQMAPEWNEQEENEE